MGGPIKAQCAALCENIFLSTTPTGKIGENFLLAKISVYMVLSTGHINTIKLPGRGGDDDECIQWNLSILYTLGTA